MTLNRYENVCKNERNKEKLVLFPSNFSYVVKYIISTIYLILNPAHVLFVSSKSFPNLSILLKYIIKIDGGWNMRKKIREFGITIGRLPVGEKNCITDVEGVKVGHVTLDYPIDDQGTYACTGVTAILPHGGNLFKEKVTAASYVLNGFGKTTGLVQINELGVIESPIMLTNTFGVPAVTQGTLEYMLEQNPEIGISTGTINIVVGECNDSYLNSIRACPVTPEHAIEAIQNAI